MVHLVARDPHADDEVRRRPSARTAAIDLAQEAQPVLEAAAIVVVAQVDPRVEELRRQIAMAGHDLDSRRARRACMRRAAARHSRATISSIMRLRQRPRHDMEALVGHGRGRVGDAGSAAVPASMISRPGWKSWPKIRQPCAWTASATLAVAGNAVVVVAISTWRCSARSRERPRPGAMISPAPPRGPRLLIGDQPRDGAVHRPDGVVAGREDAVLERAAPDAQRLQQVWKCRHRWIVVELQRNRPLVSAGAFDYHRAEPRHR